MKPILKVLQGERVTPVPIWMMRQAGRYLPEYRELRASAGGFLDMVYNPDLACEITMQPIRRYEMDGAILFSDILIVPHALGQKLEFVPGTGPVLEPVRKSEDFEKLSHDHCGEKFDSVASTVSKVRQTLDDEGFKNTTTIGFAGSPWTVACYMVEGGASKDFLNVKSWASSDDPGFDHLIEMITQATITYLRKQIEAGAEALQLFDSWAGILDDALFEKYVIAPTRAIIDGVRASHPETPIIGFPRGAGYLYDTYVSDTGIDGLGLDPGVCLKQAKKLQQKVPVQGNLDPAYLLGEERPCLTRVEYIIQSLSDGPHIFNLGHGVNKQTDPDRVRKMVEMVRGM